jgi:hypothetical protein
MGLGVLVDAGDILEYTDSHGTLPSVCYCYLVFLSYFSLPISNFVDNILIVRLLLC